MATTRSWERLSWLVRERPSTAVVLDSGALPGHVAEDAAVGELRRRYPSVAAIFVVQPRADPVSLFRLGRAGRTNLVLLPATALATDVARAMHTVLLNGTSALVTRAVSSYVPSRESMTIRIALEAVQRGWATEELAAQLGLTRPHLSVRLRNVGLPSAGHLLIWAKLLHAGRWLTDPGRSAESISRQLEYSSGAAFRRALRAYVGATPTEVKEGGGLRFVLRRFLDACGLGGSVVFDRSVA
ncbi:MAG: AraC family transcriptional regulator [Gemmatimonadota bacterium]|nr:AraC family transcriptional regulator [Gemmatimonadota bacterium]